MATDGIRVNFSDQEAASEGKSFDPIPSGRYLVAITDIELKESTSEKNFGKPYWHMELTVQEGDHTDRKLWTNVMLFEGALYSLSQLLKSTGNAEALKTGKIPPADSFIGKKVVAVVKRQVDKYLMEQDPTGPKEFKNEVKGFQPASAMVGAAGSASSSLLP